MCPELVPDSVSARAESAGHEETGPPLSAITDRPNPEVNVCLYVKADAAVTIDVLLRINRPTTTQDLGSVIVCAPY